jgi:transposase InsO family protein
MSREQAPVQSGSHRSPAHAGCRSGAGERSPDAAVQEQIVAMVETVFKTIKSELIWRTAFITRDQASKAIGRYIEGFYNPRRRHSSLGYVSPLAFEAAFRTDQNEERMALH